MHAHTPIPPEAAALRGIAEDEGQADRGSVPADGASYAARDALPAARESPRGGSWTDGGGSFAAGAGEPHSSAAPQHEGGLTLGRQPRASASRVLSARGPPPTRSGTFRRTSEARWWQVLLRHDSSPRRTVWLALEGPFTSVTAAAIAAVLATGVVASVASFVCTTEPSLMSLPSAARAMDVVEAVSTALFSLELAVRLWACPGLLAHLSHLSNSLMLFVDVAAVLPWYVQLAATASGTASGANAPLQALSLVRVARLFKVIHRLFSIFLHLAILRLLFSAGARVSVHNNGALNFIAAGALLGKA